MGGGTEERINVIARGRSAFSARNPEAIPCMRLRLLCFVPRNRAAARLAMTEQWFFQDKNRRGFAEVRPVAVGQREAPMARSIRRAVERLVALCALCALAVGCTAGNTSEVNTFRLRSEQADVQAAAGLVLDALASELQTEGLLEPPYPVVGHVTTTPDPLDPNVEVVHCTEGRSDDPQGVACILLNQAGDFARVKPITWQSAAFYRYRIYVSPRSLFARIDPSRDFVAIDMFLKEDSDLGDAVVQAIPRAAQELGARPFRP